MKKHLEELEDIRRQTDKDRYVIIYREAVTLNNNKEQNDEI